jgi:hypothetical protein
MKRENPNSELLYLFPGGLKAADLESSDDEWDSQYYRRAGYVYLSV